VFYHLLKLRRPDATARTATGTSLAP